jgi:hypothetical protein
MRERSNWPTILLTVGLACTALILLMVGMGHAAPLADQSHPSVSADGIGIARFTSPYLHADVTETFCLVYTTTVNPILTNGGIRVIDPDFHGMGWAMWQKFQTMNPNASGYLTVTSSNPSVTLVISREQTAGVQDQSYTDIVVTAGTLGIGDEVTVCFIGGRTPHRSYQNVAWQTLTDDDGDGTFAPIGVPPRLDILPSPVPSLMVASGPTYVEVGEQFTLTVRVLDEYSNPCEDFVDTLTFTSTDSLADLPPASTPFPSGRGVRNYPVTLNTTGIHYIYVDPAGPLPAVNSSPFVVVDSLATQPQLFWGDLHGHHGYVYTNTMSQRVDEYMEYARDIADLDFACESHKSSSYFNTAATHVEIEESMFDYYAPGRFVTIRGYEWMGNVGTQGHHNAYFSGPLAGPLHSPDDDASDTLNELWWLLETTTPPGETAIAPPHAMLTSPVGSGSNWHDFIDHDLNRRYRPLVELYSHWGSSEEGGHSAREALAYGLRIGFYGSSDTHFAYPGNPQTESWGPRGQDQVSGLAAVYAPVLTRDSLWQGLNLRRTYATEGERIYLNVTVNGYPMGSEITTTLEPRIVVTVAGTTAISSVEVFRGTYVTDFVDPGSVNDYYTTLYQATPNQMVVSFEVTDPAFDSNSFYYVRVTQADGKRAWSSPVWVDYGTPVDLWDDCGNSAADLGETLLNCPIDTQIPQASWLDQGGGAPAVVVSDTVVPMLGLHVYNVSNITGYVPYTAPLWVTYMQQQIDRVAEAGLSYLGFSSMGYGLYTGPPYPTPVTLTNPIHWDLDHLDTIFDYASQRSVYLLPTVNTSKSPGWWASTPATHTEMIQIDNTGQPWPPTVSFNNSEYWDTVDPFLNYLVSHFRDHPALLGWDVRVGEGENNYPPPYVMDPHNPPDDWCDYSPYAVRRFRLWLRDRYNDNVDLLRAVWVSPSVTFGTAMIPYPLDDIPVSTMDDVILYANSSGDERGQFRDWVDFRLHEKWAETQHFTELFRSLDPDHIILNDPAYHPTAEASPRVGRQDGDQAYRADSVDLVIHHPRIAHEDDVVTFNSSRSTLYNTDQYAALNGKMATWANEETSEVSAGYDVDNIWRLASVDVMHAAMGQGDGWTVGNEFDPWNALPVWSEDERIEMRRLSPLHTAPDLESQAARVAVLTDDFHDGFDYPLTGSLAQSMARPIDRKNFIENLFESGLAHDLLTTGNILDDPSVLQNYDAVLVMNLPRLTTTVAYELHQYRDAGGGLFVAGVTGRMDAYGRPNTETLQTLLGVTVTGWITGGTGIIGEWEFDTADPLVGALNGTVVTDNVYYIPTLPAGSGFTELAHLTGPAPAPVVGYWGRTVFWFPRLMLDELDQILFQHNLWDFFGVEPDGEALGAVEVVGGNYRSVFTPQPETVQVSVDDDVAATGGLVWDWNGMEMVGVVPTGPSPAVTFDTEANGTYFLGVTPRIDAVQFVAVSGGLLGPVQHDVGEQRMSVGVYRTEPGRQVTLGFYLGAASVDSVSVDGASLVGTRVDPRGYVYLVTVTSLENRLTVTLGYERRVFLPLILRGN